MQPQDPTNRIIVDDDAEWNAINITNNNRDGDDGYK